MPKSRNLEAVYKKLQEMQFEVLDNSQLASITNNCIFYSRKVDPERQNVFSFLVNKSPNLDLARNLLLLPFKVVYKSCHEVFRNILGNILVKRKDLKWTETGTLILSHSSGLNEVRRDFDPFFGALEQRVSKISEVHKIELPHGTIIDIWRTRKLSSSGSLLPTFLPVFDFFKVLVENIGRVFEITKFLLCQREISASFRRYLSYAALEQLSRSSFSDLIISENLKRVIDLVKPKVVVITYEGHTFELSILSKLPDLFVNTRFIAYQHAPIVSSQFGFFSGLQFFRGNTILATSGEVTRDLILKVKTEITSNIVVLGSSKYFSNSAPLKEKFLNRKLQILAAPESSIYALEESLAGVKEYLAGEEFEKIILRVHPRLISFRGEIETILQGYKDVSISVATLDQDLKESDICVYRSSAVGIQAMQFGVVPVYFAFISPKLLDPIYLIAERGLLGANLSNMYNLGTGFNLPAVSVDKGVFLELHKLGVRYFSDFSDKQIQNLFQL